MSVFKLLAGAEAPTQLVPVIHVVEAAAALQSIVAACAEIATQTTHPHAITRRVWRRKTQPVEASNVWEGITGLRISRARTIILVFADFYHGRRRSAQPADPPFVLHIVSGSRCMARD